jgi:hypothetical protein
MAAKVTAPVNAYSPPLTDALVPPSTVIELRAIIVPANVQLVPNVAEEPTCQYTFDGKTPPERTTCELVAVVNVVGIWKTNTSVAEPLSVSVPVKEAEEL